MNCRCSSSIKYLCTAVGNLDGVREPLVWCPVPTQIYTCSRCRVRLTLNLNCAISRFNTGIASPTCRPCRSSSRGCPGVLLLVTNALEFLHSLNNNKIITCSCSHAIEKLEAKNKQPSTWKYKLNLSKTPPPQTIQCLQFTAGNKYQITCC